MILMGLLKSSLQNCPIEVTVSTPKNYNLLNMYSPTDHPIYRWVCCFIGSDLAKFNIASLAHQCHKFNQKCTLCDNLLTVMSQTNMLLGISYVGQNRTHLEESSHNSLPHNGGLYSIIVCLFHFMIVNMNCCSMEKKSFEYYVKFPVNK